MNIHAARSGIARVGVGVDERWSMGFSRRGEARVSYGESPMGREHGKRRGFGKEGEGGAYAGALFWKTYITMIPIRSVSHTMRILREVVVLGVRRAIRIRHLFRFVRSLARSLSPQGREKKLFISLFRNQADRQAGQKKKRRSKESDI